MRPAGSEPFESPSSRRLELPVLILTLAALTSSIAALLLHVAGWLAFPYGISYVTLPGMLSLFAILSWARVVDHRLLINRIWVGTVAGVYGLIAYDVSRLAVQDILSLDFDAFIAIRSFGSLITNEPIGSSRAAVAGWSYHISNGWTFALAYALIAGPARWWFGLIWGIILEVGMLIIYPVLFQTLNYEPFLMVSILGHAFYGAVLGVCCRKWALKS